MATFGCARGLWKEIAAEEPETVTENPRQGGVQEEGIFANRKLLVVQARERLDVLLAASLDDGQPPESLGDYDTVSEDFAKVTTDWLRRATDRRIKRVALGVVVRLPVPTREAGYEQLGAYLPFRPDPASSDLLYQINRRRPSKVFDSSVNRLSKWSVAFAQSLSLAASGSLLMLQPGSSPPRHACRLELDINTVPEKALDLPGPSTVALIHELSLLGRELMEHGDKP